MTEIRLASVDDWPAIWPFFRAIVEQGETYAYPSGLTSAQGRDLWFDATSAVYVATRDGEVVATLKMGPNRPGRGAHVATASFMVDERVRGQGVARQLGETLLESAKREGYRAIQFNAVVETNEVAVHLWQSLGFRILTTVPEAFDHPTRGFVGLHVMYRSL